ncbi:MAG: transporter substrate-binding domain-containing protein [Pseudomonadales bacterium]|nr:transporter substrate-binding domain-containing protein [Pseudomonadales bacterium]
MHRQFSHFLISFLAVTCLGLSSVLQACDNGFAIISGRTNYPPLTWREGDTLDGGLVQLAKNLFLEVDIEASSDEGGPWKRILLRAQRGEIDLLLGIRRTKEREKYLIFIEPPVAPAVQSIFVHKDRDFKYKNWDDLKGKTGNITLGAQFGKEFDTYSRNNLDIERSETPEQIFKKLVLNRVDYMLGPLATTILFLEKEELSFDIINKNIPLTVINEYFAIPRNSPCARYAEYIGEGLRKVTSGEEMDRILETNFMIWFDQKGISEDLKY